MRKIGLKLMWTKMKIKPVIKKILNNAYICYLRLCGIKIGHNVIINGRILFTGTNKVVIEDNVYINSNERSNPIGGNIRCYFKTMGDGRIIIKKGARLSNVAICSNKEVYIGENVYIGGDVCIYDTDFHSIDYNERVKGDDDDGIKSLPVKINEGVFIGAHSIILKGVEIGKRSVIAAGSIIAKNINENVIVASSSLRLIKEL